LINMLIDLSGKINIQNNLMGSLEEEDKKWV